MSDAPEPKPRRADIWIEELREIGWKYWDPIGLAAANGSADAPGEYDNYLTYVTRSLLDGVSDRAAVDYLCMIASDHMGLGHADRRAAEETIAAIRHLIDNLGPWKP